MSNIDKNELKIQALTQSIAQLTADYETKIADLRVELTIISQEKEELEAARDAETPEQTRSSE